MKNLNGMKGILYGEGGGMLSYRWLWKISTDFVHLDPSPEMVAQLAQETYGSDLLYLLVLNMPRLDFESRKDVAQIFNNLLRRQIGSRWPTVEYLCAKPDVLFSTVRG